MIYVEGGGDSKALRRLCAEGFHKLLVKCGFSRMPRLVACGGRGATYERFCTEHATSSDGDYVALLVDSEDPVTDIGATWRHLRQRDNWTRPNGATDDQVLLMVTCVETWVASDRKSLADHYGAGLQESALPPLVDLEGRARETIQEALTRATRNCSNFYTKGKRSFEVLGKLDPGTLEQYLPSFSRARAILASTL